MIDLRYAKECHGPKLAAEIVRSTSIPVEVGMQYGVCVVRSYASLNQTDKDAITAVVAAHDPSDSYTEETVALP